MDYILQQTINKPITCSGIGVHSGKKVKMRIIPAVVNAGIVFVRSDIKENNLINAVYSNVVETTMCTAIANEYGARVSTIEHLMSAFWGCGIDNAVVEVDADEIPIMDGSAAPFVSLIQKAGIRKQPMSRRIIEITKPLKVEVGDKFIELLPSDHFEITYDINFVHQAIGEQQFYYNEKDESYHHGISRARTFGFADELEKLKSLGLAKGASLENAIGLDESGIMNKEGLRYKDEFVRHKILDCIGDLYLASLRIKARVHAAKAGHAVHNLLLRKLFAEPQSYRIIEFLKPKIACVS